MMDERPATWKLLLPHCARCRVLVVGLSTGQLISLARTLDRIEYHGTDDFSLSHLPERLKGKLVEHGNCPDEKNLEYDLILVGKSEASDYSLKKLYNSLLSSDGTLVCVGFSGCPFSLSQLKRLTGDIKEYGVLPYSLPRIIYPLANHLLRAKGLLFHRPGRWQIRAGITIAYVLSRFGYTNHLKRGNVIIVNKGKVKQKNTLKKWLTDRLNLTIQDLVLYCGSESNKRKITVLAMVANGEDLVVKVADTDAGKMAIRQESKALKEVARLKNNQVHIPELILEEEWAGYLVQVQTNLPRGNNQEPKLQEQHLQFLAKLACLDCNEQKLSQTVEWQQIQKQLSKTKTPLPEPFAKIHQQLSTPTLQNTVTPCHRSHGDFAPWNIGVSQERIALWDWEDSLEHGLLYADVFHFVIRQAILIGPWDSAANVVHTIADNSQKLRAIIDLPETIPFSLPLKIWLIKEYLTSPSSHLLELAQYLEAQNG